MTEIPRLSVVIPCYNGADTIGGQLESLAQQRWSRPWEIVIADNGSNDGSRDVIEHFRPLLPSVRVINASLRSGQPFALNAGVEAAAAEHIALVDADDAVAPGWVAAIGGALGEYDLVGSRFDTDKLNPPWVQAARPNPQEAGVQNYDYPPFLPHAAGSGLSFRREVFEELQGFDETLPMLHDTDFCWRAQLAGYRLGFASDAVVYYRFRTELRGMYKQSKGYARYNVILYKRYREKGMPSLPMRRGIQNWKALIRHGLYVRTKADLAKWVRQFGWQMGRLQGCIQCRVMAL